MAYTYYARMNETSGNTVSDSINGLDDTSVTSAIVAGVAGNARRATGGGSQVVYPTTNAGLVQTSNQFIGSFLIKFDSITGRPLQIQGTSQQEISCRFETPTVLWFYTGNGGPGNALARNHNFVTNRWYHVVLRRNTVKEMRVDGKMVANNIGASQPVAFGNGGTGNGFSFLGVRNEVVLNCLGSMDEVIIDNADRSWSRIKNQYLYYKGFI